jgi:hypothetical protein
MKDQDKSPACWEIYGETIKGQSPAMIKFRKALLATFTWWEKDRILTLAPGFEQHKWAVKIAVGRHSDIAERLDDCGTLRSPGNYQECRVPLCPRCFMLRRGRETRKNIREIFHGCENTDLGLLSVLLPVTTDLRTVRKSMAQHKQKIVNMLAVKRRADARWNTVHMVGYWELNRYSDTDYVEFGRLTQIAVDKLNWPLTANGLTVWHPHFHAIVARGEVSLAEVRDLFRHEAFDQPYQVDLRPFETTRPVESNLQSVTRYCMKFRIEDDFKRKNAFDVDDRLEFLPCEERAWWPKADVAAYTKWLCDQHGAFRAMRFRIGPKRKNKQTASTEAVEEVSEVSNGIEPVALDAIGSLLQHDDVGSNNNNSVLDTNWMSLMNNPLVNTGDKELIRLHGKG